MIYLYLAVGGVAGTFARFWMSGWITAGTGEWFPWGTLAVNLLGSALLGVAIGLAEGGAVSPEVRAMVTVGLCGAFTTFSTMSYETVVLMQDGAWLRAGTYAIGGLGLGLVAIVAGLEAARLATA